MLTIRCALQIITNITQSFLEIYATILSRKHSNLNVNEILVLNLKLLTRGENVVILGASYSGADIGLELVPQAEKVSHTVKP